MQVLGRQVRLIENAHERADFHAIIINGLRTTMTRAAQAAAVHCRCRDIELDQHSPQPFDTQRLGRAIQTRVASFAVRWLLSSRRMVASGLTFGKRRATLHSAGGRLEPNRFLHTSPSEVMMSLTAFLPPPPT